MYYCVLIFDLTFCIVSSGIVDILCVFLACSDIFWNNSFSSFAVADHEHLETTSPSADNLFLECLPSIAIITGLSFDF